MRVGAKSVNIVGVGGMNPDKAKFEVFFNDELNFLPTKEEVITCKIPKTIWKSRIK